MLELQRTLDSEKTSRQQEIQQLKEHQQVILEAEDKKYHRRLASLQDRLNAKDKEYTEIIERHSLDSTSHEDDTEKEALIESLKVELAKEKERQKDQEPQTAPENQVCPTILRLFCCIFILGNRNSSHYARNSKKSSNNLNLK